ncbi:type II toxin-antitoxin system Phd/YefM family antitoxin [Mycolicibacterium vanbaalenii]|uniref:Prevent-host-death family protein n=1 Tax=Mycolicibacterium vanbaalenii (strain DSM 7251 / JCM 13017 / BCRC 16820 / KCTC 9966 / NRRL B-24157 / PYR-1) TaxID=350058 RepID=A1T5T9_MYCVP|nr:type II toxin-antitoxin system prevent-host-death family antitoxin [Mycolicibacterium vanbaalenii]ABM12539.1 prevent-host-death family protein [Mycolicibacterium vanbaalenii PYR-1]
MVLRCGVERIGVRELRQHASTWVAKAQAGETIEITSRGRLVARLTPVADALVTREALIDSGQLVPAASPRRMFDRARLVDAAPLSAILDEQRADR